ncbi:MAG: hypothetical protein HYT80_08245 [Euryarchaeota archaeon]|nr:hypothetical protein [Euryarchaeota archaeon]
MPQVSLDADVTTVTVNGHKLPPGLLLELKATHPEYDADLLAITQEVNRHFVDLARSMALAQKALAKAGPYGHVTIATSREGLYLAFCSRLGLDRAATADARLQATLAIHPVIAKRDPLTPAGLSGGVPTR